MKELTLIDMIKDLKDNYERDKYNKDWKNYFKNKYKNVIDKYNISIRFDQHSNNKMRNLDNINILLKSSLELSQNLNYQVHARPSGYYCLISDFHKDNITLQIGVGTGIIENSWYKTSEYNDFIQEEPYKAAISRLESEGKSFQHIDNKKSYMYLNIDKCSNETLDQIIQEYKTVISYYPTIMEDYNSNHREISEAFKMKYNETNLARTHKRQKGELFTIYTWTLMKVEKQVDPVNIDLGEDKDDKVNKENEKNIVGKNIIIYGVPGSGKSYSLKKDILNGLDEMQYERIIFYPEYTYYDFVGQMVPAKNGQGLEFAEGPFVRILKKALADEDEKPYYLIIEEMNRGNAEAIFGDILQLLDRDEEGESIYSISNENIEEKLKDELNGRRVYIPTNLFIYATINNSDQNVFNLDTAFSRRWEYEIKPCNGNNDETSKKYLERKIKGTSLQWNSIRKEINKMILNTEEIYNAEDKRLGPYYIDVDCLKDEDEDENQDYEKYREKFASKIFRYLWLDVFKNCRDKIFRNANKLTLEDIILKFKENGDINNILIFERDNDDEE